MVHRFIQNTTAEWATSDKDDGCSDETRGPIGEDVGKVLSLSPIGCSEGVLLARSTNRSTDFSIRGFGGKRWDKIVRTHLSQHALRGLWRMWHLENFSQVVCYSQKIHITGDKKYRFVFFYMFLNFLSTYVNSNYRYNSD